MADKQATIIYNPMSGQAGQRAQRAREMIRLLGRRGIEAVARETAGPGDATRLARDAVDSGVDIILCYGGDGTINEVIQPMAGSNVALGVWAGGTANVVARDLEMPMELKPLAEVIAKGRTRRIALGLAVRATGGAGSVSSSPHTRVSGSVSRPVHASRYFIMFAGIGLDASVALKVNHRLKRKTGQFAYWVEGLKHLWTWPADLFELTVDGRMYQGVFAVLGKGKGYGGGIRLTPGARLEEPFFEVFILPRMPSNFSYLRDLTLCLRGKPEKSSATIIRGSRIEANSTAEPWVELDGEVIGTLPMSFQIAPDALSVIIR